MMLAPSPRAPDAQADGSARKDDDTSEPAGDGPQRDGSDLDAGAHSRTPPAAPQPPARIDGGLNSSESVAQSTESAAAYFARKQYLNNYLIRDRDYRILLRSATTSLTAGDESQAIEALQTVWDAPQDVLVWDDGRQQAESVRMRADELMRQTGHTTRDAYERCFGGAAERLLESVLAEHDADAERELLRRFSHTRAAGQLLEMRALRAMDRGELDEAIGYWRQLLSDPWQHGGLDMPHSVQALLLCRQLQYREGVAESGPLEKWLPAPASQQQELPSIAGIRLGHRDVVRQADASDGSMVSAPINEPLWTSLFLDEAIRQGELIRLVSDSAPGDIVEDLEDVVGAWAERQKSDRLPLGGATAAVMHGDLVIVRDFSGVTARGARDGDVRWQYECQTSLCRVLEELAGMDDPRSREHRRPTPRADLFAGLVADHSTLSTLTTDGERVYVIDEIGAVETGLDTAEPGESSSPLRRRGLVLRNRLVALAIDGPEQGRRSWSRGGSEEGPQSGLGRFFFLGPPRPHAGDLYAIGEQDDQLQIVVLDAATGSVRWKQLLSLVDLPVVENESRSRMACLPLVSQGVVVCPTQLPVLVGLDAITGTLKWVYHAAGEERPDSLNWIRHVRGSGPDDCGSQPVIVGSQLLLIPPASSKLHCIDIHSGQRLWWVDAHQARYVAGAADDKVLLVGPDECIGLSLADGSLQWRTPIDAPAGRGVVVGDAYLLPLNSGQFVEVRLADGSIRPDLMTSHLSESATHLPTAGRRLGQLPGSFGGNFLIHEDLFVCCSATGLSVFPQARSMLSRLRSAAEPASPAVRLRRAELHMRLCEWNAAIDELRLLLAANPPESIRQRGMSELRELLYFTISEDPASRIEELANLVSAPPEVARYLLHRLEHELHIGLVDSAVQTTDAIRDLRVQDPIRMDHSGRYMVLPLEQARFSLESYATMADDVELASLRMAMRMHLEVDQEIDAGRLREASVLLHRWSPDESLSRRLARQLDAAGEFQAAELVMLGHCDGHVDHLCSGGTPEIRYRVSLHDPAIRTHLTSGASSIGPALPSTGEYVVSYHPDNDVTLAGFEEPQAIPAVDIREVAYRQFESGTDDGPCSRLTEILDGKSHFLHLAGKTVRLLQTEAQFSAESAARFAVIADDGITEVGSIETPPARWLVSESARYGAGHLVPLQGKGVLMLSLLERRILWHEPPRPEQQSMEPLLGPYGDDFCVLQLGRELTVVDPVTGQPLWHRQGLRYQAGLATDEQTGVTGDSRVIVVFDTDLVAYELFETRSGTSLRRGVLPITKLSGTRHLTNFGRRLMYRTEIDGVLHIRIWDPLDDRLLFDAPVDGRFCWCPMLEQQRVALLMDRSLMLIDGTTGDCEWGIDVAEDHLEHVRKALVFSDGGVDFVLLERHMRDSPSNISGLDIRVPSTELSGDLYAVDRVSGGPLWGAPLAVHPSHVLNLQHHALPFLVTVSRVRDPQDNETYRLKVNVIEIDTGRLVGSHSNLTNMPILHTSYDSTKEQLTLWGPERRIEIGYSLLTVSRH